MGWRAGFRTPEAELIEILASRMHWRGWSLSARGLCRRSTFSATFVCKEHRHISQGRLLKDIDPLYLLDSLWVGSLIPVTMEARGHATSNSSPSLESPGEQVLPLPVQGSFEVGVLSGTTDEAMQTSPVLYPVETMCGGDMTGRYHAQSSPECRLSWFFSWITRPSPLYPLSLSTAKLHSTLLPSPE